MFLWISHGEKIMLSIIGYWRNLDFFFFYMNLHCTSLTDAFSFKIVKKWRKQYRLKQTIIAFEWKYSISHVHLHVLTLAVYKTATITSTWINSFRLVCMMTRYRFIRLSTLKHVNRWNCMIVLSLPLIWERFPLQWYKYTGGLKFVKWGQFRKMSHKRGLSPPTGKVKTR